MASETQTYFGQCRCCLNHGYLKNMWSEYQTVEDVEVYGQMLIDCFALTWASAGDTDGDQICEDCITQLRNASNFKQMVLQSQEQILSNIIEAEDSKDVKPDILGALGKPMKEEVVEQIEEDGPLFMVYTEVEAVSDGQAHDDDDDSMDADNPPSPDTDNTETEQTKKDIEYQEVEYLEEEDTNKDDCRESQPDGEPVKKSKWPKKLPKAERYKTYKQYSCEDMRKALEAAMNGMPTKNAAKKYNVPLKTLASKLRNNDMEDNPNRVKTYNLMKDIKAILTYTNATPYKVKTHRYFCAYCGTDAANFEEPEDLRIHTRTKHAQERITKVDFMMRPHFLNEILRLDIHNFMCNVCCLPLGSWNEMFRHLRDKHDTVLEEAHTRVVPYLLLIEPTCALCKATFSNFMHLDGHMNAHYTNYMCVDCGDTFLTNCRLKAHEKTHETGRFACKYCPKIFLMEKYKRKHEIIVHKKVPTSKCVHCGKKFKGDYERHDHILKEHSDKVRMITCELCGSTFTMKAKFTAHMRKSHLKPRKEYKCTICGDSFSLKKQMVQHRATHVAEDRYCGICDKKLSTQWSFMAHMKRHANALT